MTYERPGEGPAHAHETWTYASVPRWAKGRPYHFRVVNRSPLNLSCEMDIDGHKAAKNAPIPPWSSRTVKPDNHRYFESHKWVFKRAERVKLGRLGKKGAPLACESDPQVSTVKSDPQRNNGVRPKDYSRRVDLSDYPDPSLSPYNWTFTGSVEGSLVEFYEKRMNFGLCRMDFYYTTGTVKTVLDHPTTGFNQLFRRCAVSPETFKQILLDPRAHTNIGYRTNGQAGTARSSVKEEGNRVDEPMTDASGSTATAAGDARVADEPMEEDGGGNSNGDGPTFSARDANYDFKEQTHANRRSAMGTLQGTEEFRAWEDAQRTEWACVAARFYVSSAQRIRRRPRGADPPGRREEDVEDLPETRPVADVRASERAVLATEFRSEKGVRLGPRPAPSRVRMERVWGLNDDPRLGTGPDFEVKLHYRLEDSLGDSDIQDGSDSEGMESDNGEMVDEGNGGMEIRPQAEVLLEKVPLEAYREEKLSQLERWHGDLPETQGEQAAEMLQQLASCKLGIQAAQTLQEVEEHAKQYWDWHQRCHWQ